MISSAVVPSSNMWTSCSMLVCRNAPGIQVTATYLPSLASIVHDSIIASKDTVGELVSGLRFYPLLLSALVEL